MTNLLPFQELQKQITAFIRDPEHTTVPDHVDKTRLSVYKDIVFYGILEKINSVFPVCHSVYSKQWDELVRDFFKQLKSTSPYFYDIPKAFVEYLLDEQNPIEVPAFLPELAHYEWIEVALDLADIAVNENQIDIDGDLITAHPVVSPLVWVLQYQYPVHKIGIAFMPDSPSQTPTFLIVKRDKQYKIDFIEISELTAHLLNLLIQDEALTGLEALNILYQTIDVKNKVEFIKDGFDNLNLLKNQSVILGTRKP